MHVEVESASYALQSLFKMDSSQNNALLSNLQNKFDSLILRLLSPFCSRDLTAIEEFDRRLAFSTGGEFNGSLQSENQETGDGQFCQLLRLTIAFHLKTMRMTVIIRKLEQISRLKS
ncbi:MAG: hypothetical protein D6728_02615 [Cyanobacteria bacterium J055]|nr:MAG: hypothetical protein D6728_02615 [Cyanobacteria bacterium J055]